MTNYERLMINKILKFDQLFRSQNDDFELFLIENFKIEFNFKLYLILLTFTLINFSRKTMKNSYIKTIYHTYAKSFTRNSNLFDFYRKSFLFVRN